MGAVSSTCLCSCCAADDGSMTVSVTEEDKRMHREAERALRDRRSTIRNQVKILLLGAGDSGKSTVVKQMRLIHNVPFGPDEREHFRQLVFANVVDGMREVLRGAAALGLAPAEHLDAYARLVEHAPDLNERERLPHDVFFALDALWHDPAVRRAVARGNEYALPDNLAYFFGDLARVFADGYEPSDADIVRARARTTGLSETAFAPAGWPRGHELVLIDVGGQKSERRKWIHCFEGVACVVFLAALSAYDQRMVEDRDANQMQDALAIWDSICHSLWFKRTAMVLFLNKNDLFEIKIPLSPIQPYFSDFDGVPGDADAGREYFKRRFARLARMAGRSSNREVYIHITTAVDTAMLRRVMIAVEEAITRHLLEDATLV